MVAWNNIPVFRLCIPFILGLLLPVTYDFSLEKSSFYALFGACSLFFLLLNHFVVRYKNRWIFGLFLNLAVLFIATSYIQLFNKESSVELKDFKHLHFAEVKEIVKQTDTTQRCIIANYNYENALMVATIKKHKELKVGDVVKFNARVFKIEAPKNPAQFDYAKFMANRLIFYQLFVDKYQIVDSLTTLNGLALEGRTLVENCYKQFGITNKNLSVLSALTLGNKSMLDFKLKEKYAGAGAMHILAVSGLHVGIIYIIISKLLFFLDKNKWSRYLKGLLSLLSIWSFAIITGLPPSVQRAACMFSIFIIATALSKKSNILNSIAVSALFLLIYNPNLIFEVGFQLSYSAVIGIVILQPIFSEYIYSSNKIVNYFLQLFTVSLSAQIATLPFTIYYFHQFPTWFFIANLFVIPMAFIIVIGAVLLISVSGFSFVAQALAIGLNKVISLLNYAVEKVNLLPNAIIKGLWMSELQFFLLLIALGLFLSWALSKRNALLVGSLLLVLTIACMSIVENTYNKTAKEFTIYALRNNGAYSVRNGFEARVYAYNGELSPFEKNLIINHLNSIGVENYQFYETKSTIEVVGDKVFVFSMGGKLEEAIYKKHILPDFIVFNKENVSEKTVFKLKGTVSLFDASVKQYTIDNRDILESGDIVLDDIGSYGLNYR